MQFEHELVFMFIIKVANLFIRFHKYFVHSANRYQGFECCGRSVV